VVCWIGNLNLAANRRALEGGLSFGTSSAIASWTSAAAGGCGFCGVGKRFFFFFFLMSGATRIEVVNVLSMARWSEMNERTRRGTAMAEHWDIYSDFRA